jgi:hypothetical protein
MYYDTKHSDSNQTQSGEFKKQTSTCHFSTGSPTKYVRNHSDSSEQVDEMNSDISHQNVKSSRPFTANNCYKICSYAVPQRFCSTNFAKKYETITRQ